MNKLSFSFLKPPIGRKLRLIMLFFALLFSLSAIAQYLFIKRQLDKARTSQAEARAAEIKEQLTYTTNWNLKEFRQADWEAPNSFILATNRVLVEVEGFIPGLMPLVTLPDALDYEHPQSQVSEIGEPWRLLARRIQGGTVVLGVSYPDNLTVVDEKLLADARKFGSTLESGSNIRARSIAVEVEFCVVDDFGNLQYAIGDIPLKAKTPFPTITSTQLRDVVANGHSYSLFTMPVLDSSNMTVAAITVPMDTTSEHETLGKPPHSKNCHFTDCSVCPNWTVWTEG